MPFATVNGVKLHYRIDRAARDDAPWLVFSNSLGADLQMWAPQIRPLTQHFNILRYDTRGHAIPMRRPVRTRSTSSPAT